MKKILTLLFLLGAFVVGYAQSGEISGTVSDETGSGVPFGNVALVDGSGKPNGKGTQTDMDGKYTLKGLAPGRYNILFSYVGYQSQIVNGVEVNADKTRFLDSKLKPASNTLLKEVEVVTFKKPLIDKGDTKIDKTVSSADIKNSGYRKIEDAASQTAGVYQEDAGKGLSIRGSRAGGVQTIVDGIKTNGNANIPAQSVQEINIITGGIPARFGDLTAGVINITTKGPQSNFIGGVDFQTSQGLDKFGYNQATAYLLGPLLKTKDKKRTIMGFSASFDYFRQQDPDPSAVGVWQVKDNVLAAIKKDPLIPNPTGKGFFLRSEQVTFQDMYKTEAKPNTASAQYSGLGSITISPKEGMNFTVGGSALYKKYNSWVREYTLFNSENNPLYKELNYRAYVRFNHNIGSGKSDEGKSKVSYFKNPSYTIQVDFEKDKKEYADETHGNKLFNYGYIGKFETQSVPNFSYSTKNIGGRDYTGFIQTGSKDTGVAFTPGKLNDLGTRFTEQYFQLLGAKQNANGAYEIGDDKKIGFAENIDQIAQNSALINGQRSTPLYSLWYNVGRQYNGYGVDKNNEQYRGRLDVSFDIQKPGTSNTNVHKIELGAEYEQRVQRFYSINPLNIWDIARSKVNSHLSLDTLNPVFRIEGKNYSINDPARPNFYFTDSIFYGNKGDAASQSYFDKQLRRRLGLGEGNTDKIDMFAVDVDKLSVDLFSATELMSQFIVTARGYDHTGKVLTNQPTLDDFFKGKNADGEYTRLQGAFRPVYAAGYIQDKFYYKDLGFVVGLRVDQYNANQSVLKDEFSLYEVKTASQVNRLLDKVDTAGNLTYKNVSHPSNIGGDYAVYLNKSGAGAQIAGYRKGDKWFDKYGRASTGQQVATESAEGIFPYVNLPGIDTMSVANAKKFVQNKNYDPSVSFTKYVAKYTFMPRLQFAFNITEDAQFFAHYDVLSQRPQGSRNQLNLSEYFYFSEDAGVKNNPNLKPETTIDYEFGFKQKVSKSSAVTISAYYKEFRNLIQLRKIYNAFPADYTTYDNIDFVSSKGINIIYDMRRTGNFKLDANYTLQFAEGTGSDDNSQQYLVNAGNSNFRTVFPVSSDARHTINLNLDYRYGEGKEYNGPVIKNKQILANFGINLTLRARSGTPTREQATVSEEGLIGGSGRGRTTSLNARLPWNFRADLRINKDFTFMLGKKKEGQEQKRLSLQVFLLIQNLFGTANPLSYYAYTGNANDDGYLAAEGSKVNINSQYNPQSFSDLYRAKVNNPENYSLPRRIFLGASFNF